jgi:hypothetical protein
MDGKKLTRRPTGTKVFIETMRESRKTAGVNAGVAGWACRVAAYLNL